MAPRRRRLRPLVVVGLVVLAVLIVVVALPGSESSPDQQSYMDIIRPQLQLSAQQGTVVSDIRANASSSDRLALFQRLNDLVGNAASVQRTVAAVGPPWSLRSAGDLVNGALRMRAQGAVSLRDGLQAVLSDTPGDGTTLLVRAGQQLSAADDLYGGFLRALSPSMAASVSVPEYRWATNPADWDPPALGLYTLGLRASPTLAVRHDVAVVLVSTQPAPTSYAGTVAVLGLTRSLKVGVVVADRGNVAEHGVPVVVTLGGGGAGQSSRTTVDLDPGQRLAVDLGGLSLAPRSIYALTVTVGPVAGDPTPGDGQQTEALAVTG